MKLKTIIILALFTLAANKIYSQIDSLENRILYHWKLNPYDLSMELVQIDTTLTQFQNFNPLLKNTISSNYPGNLGSASQSKIYYDREKYRTGFVFSEPYAIYFQLPKEQLYYNTKRQFTVFNYSTGGPKEESEQVLGVLHTQNVSENFNFGLDYDMISSDGRYLNQEVKQNLLSLFSSYKNKGYQLHVNLGFNNVKAQENGGIDSLELLTDNDYSNRKNIPVRLDDANAQILNSYVYLAQEYNLGKSIERVAKNESEAVQQQKAIVNSLNKPSGAAQIPVDSIPYSIQNDSISDQIIISDSIITQASLTDSTRIDSIKIIQNEDSLKLTPETEVIKNFKPSGFSVSHELSYNRDIRRFSDENLDEEFYLNRDIFIDSTKTHDEVSQKQLGNKLALNYKYLDKFSAKVAFYNESMKYNYNIRPDTIAYLPLIDTIIRTDTTAQFYNNSVSAYLKAFLFKRILFKGYANYYISGYKKEDAELDLKFAYIHKDHFELSLEGKYNYHRPDFYYENYTSNHFKWSNEGFGDIEKWDVGLFVRSAKYKLNAKVQYGQITNYLYLDTSAYINQHTGKINILSAELYKHLDLGLINSITRFVYQKSTEDSLLVIPEYNLYQSLYLEHLWKFKATEGELLWQLGVDYRYTSKYSPDGYMPPLGLFYSQNDHVPDAYQCLDLFINVKIKRLRIYLKYNYLNTALNEKYYFTAPNYPAPDPIIKWGIAWTFYD